MSQPKGKSRDEIKKEVELKNELIRIYKSENPEASLASIARHFELKTASTVWNALNPKRYKELNQKHTYSKRKKRQMQKKTSVDNKPIIEQINQNIHNKITTPKPENVYVCEQCAYLRKQLDRNREEMKILEERIKKYREMLKEVL